jgi:DNA-binding cell septation regulator SpoVG
MVSPFLDERFNVRIYSTIERGSPWDAKHPITTGLNNKIVETLLPNFGREDELDSTVASISTR